MYIVINCGYHNDTSYKRNVWLYNKGNCALFKQRVGDTDWDGSINNRTDIDILFQWINFRESQYCNPQDW
jgi:hypothetical protein